MKSLLLNSNSESRELGSIPSVLTVDHSHKKLYIGKDNTLSNELILSLQGELRVGETVEFTITNQDSFTTYSYSLNGGPVVNIESNVFSLTFTSSGTNTLDLYEDGILCGRNVLSVVSPPLEGVFTQKRDSDVARNNYGAGSNDQYLLFYGGFNNGDRLTAGRRYAVASDRWGMIASGPSARNLLAGCVHNGFFYLAGGYDGSLLFSDFWRYDISRNLWFRLSDLPVTEVNRGSLCSHGNYVYFHCSSSRYFGRYDVNTDTWTSLSAEGLNAGLTRNRLISDGETIFYLSTDLYRFNESENKWFLISSVPWNTSATVVTAHSDGNIYALDQNAGFFVFMADNNWTRISDCPVSTSSLVLLSAGDKLYLHTSGVRLWEIS